MPFLVVMPQAQPGAYYGVDLNAVHGTTGNVWVVGGRVPFFASPYLFVARRWNGTTWEDHDRASVFGAGTKLATVFADSTDGAWVSGDADDAPVQRFTGGVWTTETPGAGYFTGTDTDLTVFDAYASATPTELAWDHWDGSAWDGLSHQGPTNVSDYTALFLGRDAGAWGAPQLATQRPDGMLYVLGNATTASTAPTVILHRHPGGDVHESARYASSYSGRAIWAPTNTDIYALLNNGSASQLNWTDGTGSGGTEELWFVQTIPSGNWDFLHGVAVNDWWLAGAGGNVAHWDGASYSTDTLPTPFAGFWIVTGLWAVATDDVWICGWGTPTGALYDQGLVWHWDGAAWSLHTVFTS